MKGGCLCSTVRYEANGSPLYAGHCHCRDCQRATGTGHLTAVGFNKYDVRIEGELRVYATKGGSGREVRRYFCPTCGSYIFSESDARPGAVNLAAGTLDDPGTISPTFSVFDRDRHAWDYMSPEIERRHTGLR
jgi:hypothetical protein